MDKAKPQIMETHGQDESQEAVATTTPPVKFKPTLLSQVWGDDGLDRYGTGNETEYAKRLEDMNRTDLEAHARLMGVVIVESSLRLKERLLNDFRAHVAALNRPDFTPPSIKPSEAALRVLAEGR